ncbi:MAG: phosphatidate cytidylyltransferase [Gammaproteobacteria bacterium]|uniref:phosphatidate cytidylyltransferase n=1 Tax=Azohydromonas sp. TaxID=1872666 RepID=UPI002C3E7A3A|nr:phosphatidate cytidylyltransferase [Azohydromonas sp.]HMM85117.1 phosphatidate cytidylyltransferase [Azohydromonas sp.]
MLRQRVVTAVLLLALLIPALVAEQALPFALLTLALIAAAAWEWARLNGVASWGAWLSGAAVASACVVALITGWTARTPALLWWIASLVWCVGGAVALRAGPSGWPHLPRSLRWGIGVAGLWVAWLAIGQARGIGLNFVLSVFCLVWVADIAAYFGGRRFGRRKLAPSISPGKSWEGVYSGVAGVLVLALAWLWADRRWALTPSLYSELFAAGGALALLLGCGVLAAMSVVGDLVESLVKRAAGAKDSSALLPGHGGVLDRVDALLPVFPIALALLALTRL